MAVQPETPWVEVTPAPREWWDADFVPLEKGDTLEGWFIGTLTIRGQERYLVAVFERVDDGAVWRKYILPQDDLLEARMRALQHPAYIRIENVGWTKLPTGRRVYAYRVLHKPEAAPPPEIVLMVERAELG